ncbi:MAG: hypothetical protein Q8Q54_07435 [Methylococcales bacterium]|nr:hypothetical protein [Methylococcales bacterium]MDP3838737.1 hypothetical protein [Methylococcales bacterium]
MIVFTDRELKRAWREAYSAFEIANKKTNAHRLLLFYAIETGLKAILLRNNAKTDSENLEDFFVDAGGGKKSGHDLNNLMDCLKVGKEYRLDSRIHLYALKQPISSPKQRKTGRGDWANCGELNQVWRYGAQAKNPSDAELETQLLEIQKWIEGELK